MGLNLSDQELFELLCGLIVLLLSVYGLYFLVRMLERTREGFDIGTAIVVAFGLRVLAAVGLGQLSIARDLRGGDEVLFLTQAGDLAQTPLGGAESLDTLISELHVFLFSIHTRALSAEAPEFVLRAEMVAFSVIGIILLAAAVYELAGPRPALIAAWILALEPANIFFSSLLHKEPLMYLAEGLVVFGGALLWKRGKMVALVPMVLGCLIAMATGPYAGWFLTAAAAAVVLHASLTRQRGLRSIALTTTCVVLIGLAVPVVWDASSDKELEQLQLSQDANVADGANLSLERVDYSRART